ncbi:hypothetical protein ACIP9G_02165 [Lysinibacillus sp. NPDC093197]|uniref:DUF3885 domain-containing protein n=1 Tax=Lysinibacillus sp. NPDC093197 TaxID=3364132 RepID=UPI0037F89740
MQLKKFMEEHYNGLALSPDFYHNWDTGIHVELGNDNHQNYDKNYLPRFHIEYKQVSEIVGLLFKKTDDVIVVVNSYPDETKNTVNPNFFKRYVKNQKKKYSLLLQEYTWLFDEDKISVQQMELYCKVLDLKLELLLKTCIHEDFLSQNPRLKRKHSIYAPDVFLVNTNTKCIFHLYDDNGCEILNTDMEFHADLLDYFKEWNTQSKP